MRNWERLLFTLVVLFFAACKKEEITTNIAQMQVAEDKALKSIFFVNDSLGFVAGGKRDQNGFIYKTTDAGKHWQKIFDCNWCIEDILFTEKNLGVACGDRLMIVKTTDNGENWKDVPLSWYPADEYFVPLKHIDIIDDTNWFFTGGRFYDRGVSVRSHNGGLWTDVSVFQVELNTAYFKDANNGILGGYGIVYETSDGAATFTITDFKGDNFTAMLFADEFTGFVCGYDGGIYKTEDFGNSWVTSLKPNSIPGKRIHFNDLEIQGNSGIAVGMNGIVYVTSDGGNSWKPTNTGINYNLYDVDAAENGLFRVSGDNGMLITIKP